MYDTNSVLASLINEEKALAQASAHYSSSPSSTTASIKRSILFYIDDLLRIEPQAMSIIVPEDLIISEILLSVDTAPTGASLIIDLNKNGTTLYTTQANRPSIPDGSTTATITLPDVLPIAAGDIISLDIDQIGTTAPGENLRVTITCDPA